MTDKQGLTSDEAARARATCGPNVVGGQREETYLQELFESLREPLVLLLLGVGVLYVFFGELRDAFIIFGVIITVAISESSIEWRAGRAIKALSNLAQPRALVWRDNTLQDLASEQLVPGDVIELRAGVRIPADATLIDSDGLSTDESLVTGESTLVSHSQGDDSAALLGGTLVVRGSGRAEVTQIGAASTLGKIATLTASAKEPKTPMQLQMAQLARTLLIVALVASAIIPIIGVLAGRPWREMLLTGLSLAFATIPEELPVLIIVVLGFGSLGLAKRGAIVRRLRAAETLGAVTVICTDKTGTLTENRMELTQSLDAPAMLSAAHNGTVSSQRIIHAASLASERSENGSAIFDPIDAAVWAAAGDDKIANLRSFPFDVRTKLASGFAADRAGVKGSPEAVLSRCATFRDKDTLSKLDDACRTALLAVAAAQGSAGRVLGVASRSLNSAPQNREDLERELVFEGILVLHDPVRAQVPAAIATLQSAGVTVSMVTGDQATTAQAVAREAGFATGDVVQGPDLEAMSDPEIARRARNGIIVARALPADKLRLVNALQEAGEVVMVTGDGANDAPALSVAAVGVAMGRVGSDAAREAADVVLTDDNFTTLERAVHEGRRLFDNFRKAIRFYLSIKIALIVATAAAAFLALPLPFTPVQIVILELFMDLGASLAFIALPAASDTMSRPPRDPAAALLDRGTVIAIAIGGIALAAITFGAFLAVLQRAPVGDARTAALVVWMVGHVALGFGMAGSGAFRALRSNPPMLAWIAGSVGFAIALITSPPLRATLAAGPLNTELAFGIIIAAAIILWPVGRFLGRR